MVEPKLDLGIQIIWIVVLKRMLKAAYELFL